MIKQFAHMIIKVQSNTDKSWEYGSQDLIKGILHCMLEDAVNPKKNFSFDMMTLRTFHRYYAALIDPILRNSYDLNSHPLMEGKSEKAKLLMFTALHNAPNTIRTYCDVFDGVRKDWF